MAFRFEARAYDDPDVVRMVAAVQAEYVIRYGGPDESRVDVDEFVPPAGLFLVGLLDGLAVATGAWRRLGADAHGQPGEEDTAEIKRMYVAAAYRRRGLSRLMLAELERTAAAAGVRRVVLNTGRAQPEAVALYESSGYEPVAAFGFYADGFPSALFYGKTLPAAAATA